MALATASLTGPPGVPSEFFQNSPSCLPGVLMTRWAYWCTRESSCRSSAYSFCASTNPRQISIASSSLTPIRRNSTSSWPALASKYHLAAILTNGTGSGHCSGPTWSVARFGFDERTTTECAARACAANASAYDLSRTGSPVLTRSLPSGPNIAMSAGSSNVDAASISASAASLAVANARAPTGGVDEAAGLAAACLGADGVEVACENRLDAPSNI